MIDCIEFFTVLVIYSKARLEDKIRFLFEFYDLNTRGYLLEIDLHFMAFTVLTGTMKLFQKE
jgi:Ca2+-binding EF-hand superfamily protein